MNTEDRIVKSSKCTENLVFAIKKIKNQKKWTREEDEMLIALAEKYNEKHWKEISKRFSKKNSLQCFSRYKRIRPGIVKGSWKKEEDMRIIELVNKYGKSWSKISKILGTRNGKQIRDRFINVLDPEIKKGKFNEEEDVKLVLLFKQYGPKWATIAKYYPNRTADMIKNRFHSSIKKKLSGDFNESCFYDCDEEYSQHATNKMEHILNGSTAESSGKGNSFIKQESSSYIQYEHSASVNEDSEMNYQSEEAVKEEEAYYPGYSSYDILTNDNNENKEYQNNHHSFIWNFEDYFTI
jgi:hypothetical protein